MCKADVNADDADVHGEAMRAAERAKFMAKRLDAPKWIVYGQTLDLESFAREHPGGELALRLGASAPLRPRPRAPRAPCCPIVLSQRQPS